MSSEVGEGVATTIAPQTTGDLEALTRLMELSCELSQAALHCTDQVMFGKTLMETADRLAEEVGFWAEQRGYTMDQVTLSLWADTRTPQEGCHRIG